MTLIATFNQNYSYFYIKYNYLSYDVASGRGIMQCVKIDKSQVVYRLVMSKMTTITTPSIYCKASAFSHQKHNFKVAFMPYNEYNLTFVLLYNPN